MAEQTLTKPETSISASENQAGITATPRVDILEREDELLLVANLPGVLPQDVEVRFENGELILHGKREMGHPTKNRVNWEYDIVHYHRSFRLNENIKADQISADLKEGVLTVHLPKVESVKPRKIAVRGS